MPLTYGQVPLIDAPLNDGGFLDFITGDPDFIHSPDMRQPTCDGCYQLKNGLPTIEWLQQQDDLVDQVDMNPIKFEEVRRNNINLWKEKRASVPRESICNFCEKICTHSSKSNLCYHCRLWTLSPRFRQILRESSNSGLNFSIIFPTSWQNWNDEKCALCKVIASAAFQGIDRVPYGRACSVSICECNREAAMEDEKVEYVWIPMRLCRRDGCILICALFHPENSTHVEENESQHDLAGYYHLPVHLQKISGEPFGPLKDGLPHLCPKDRAADDNVKMGRDCGCEKFTVSDHDNDIEGNLGEMNNLDKTKISDKSSTKSERQSDSKENPENTEASICKINYPCKLESSWVSLKRLSLHLDPSLGDYGIPNLDVTSRRALDTAVSWINECIKQHKCSDCKPSRLPRRLISVSSSCPRLVNTDGSEGSYVALSYCWGGDQKMKLTLMRLPQYLQELPIKDMPTTIRDAIAVTKLIGIKYLWIDSLCIIQDDSADLMKELGSMADTYRNSFVTIVAASAASVEDGFLGVRERISDSIRFPIPWVVDGMAYELASKWPGTDSTILCRGKSKLPFSTPVVVEQQVLLLPKFDHNQRQYFEHNPLESRAWTLQERLLSPRLLIYSSTNLRWLCRSRQACDGGDPNLLPTHDLLPESGLGRTHSPPSRVQMWHFIVKEFSVRQLTNWEDKLPAISAVAQDHAGDDIYMAGLWRSSIADDLLWFVQRFVICPRPSPHYRAPSWSWASLDEPVSWMHYLGMCEHLRSSENPAFTTHDEFEVVDFSQKLISEDAPFAGIVTASLRLKARFLSLGSGEEVKKDFEDSRILLLDNGRQLKGRKLTGIFYAVLLGWRDYYGHEVGNCNGPMELREHVPQGLILTKDGNENKIVYRRAGVFLDSYLTKESFADAPCEEIDLV